MAASARTAPLPQREFTLAPYEYAAARELTRVLGLPEPVAVTLVRRGHRTVDDARAFLEADEWHDPLSFDRMAEVVELVRAAIAAGRRITVHGDYDADGVCSTAILVGALRSLGASCDWVIPDRLSDGYGLTVETVERLRERGTELLITADCGITSAVEVDAALVAGIDVVVTDHHEPAERLPECPILHPAVSGYPCAELCATGVAYKLSSALRGDAADADLDLVALATVADLVPLRGENRALVRRGLEMARVARRPGLRALVEAAGIDPERLDEGDFSFRIAPRINAAGRLYRADAGVELMLTDDAERAAQIAAELDRANRERRDTEAEVLRGAEAALAEMAPELAEASGLVIAGSGWHAGVVGIVASRLVERTGRPVVLIGLDEHGRGRGSGRSVPGFDLLGALSACEEHLGRYGGHRAAAGLEIEGDRIPAFRAAFAAHAAEVLGEGPALRTEEIDAVVGPDDLGLDVAEQLARLAPFGKGNPPVRLVVPAARIRDVRPMGEGERHARFSLEGATARARGVAFGVNGSLAEAAEAQALDVSLSLELNHWNGAVEPRVVLGELYPAQDDGEATEPAEPLPGAPDEAQWAARLEAELQASLDTSPARAAGASRRAIVDRRGRSGVASVAALASSGEAVLVVCADALRRRALVERAAVPARFGGGSVALAAGAMCDEVASRGIEAVLRAPHGGVALADWARIARDPGLSGSFEHVVLIDPPPLPGLEATVDGCEGRGFLHLGWGPAEVELSLRLWEAEWPSRPSLAALYRGLRSTAEPAEELAGSALRGALGGTAALPRSPEAAGRALRVLLDVGVVAWQADGGARGSDGLGALSVVSSKGIELEQSGAFGAYRRHNEEGRRYLSRRRNPK
jgi:single-stranded-DNA-specific exonuclease